MGQFIEAVRQGLAQMAAHKLRSALTLLGIFIGVAAIIGSSTLLDGVNRMVIRRFERYGQLNVMGVYASWGRSVGGRWVMFEQTYPLATQDALMLKDAFPSVLEASVQLWNSDNIRRGSVTLTNTSIMGVSTGFDRMRNLEVAQGRFLNEQDMQDAGRVCVLSSRLYDDLFLGTNAIGEEIVIADQRFIVVGVLKAQGSNTRDERSQAYIPITTAENRLFGPSWSGVTIFLQTEDSKGIPLLLEQVPEYLSRRYPGSTPEHFDTWSVGEWQSDALKDVEAQGKILYAVAFLCLLTGGIGIMNIMLVSVTERTREIGLRKAVGAKSRQILMQFLLEAVVLSMAGGLCGVAGGWGLGAILKNIMSKTLDDPQALVIHLGPGTLLVALGTAAGVALIFGIFPAMKAARLDPIVALRYE